MKPWKTLRIGLSSLLERTGFMTLGAWLFLKYIEVSYPIIGHSLRHLDAILGLSVCLLGLIVNFTVPREPVDSKLFEEPIPQRSGALVVLLTGFMFAFFVTGSSDIAAVIATIATIMIAAVVWRFAAANAHKIGEARFPNSGTIEP